jgi:hypothetical protein
MKKGTRAGSFYFHPSFYVGSGIEDEKCSDPGSGMKKMLRSGSGIKKIPDPQPCLHLFKNILSSIESITVMILKGLCHEIYRDLFI